MTGKEALETLVPTESSQDKGNFPVRSRPEENYPRVETSLKFELLANLLSAIYRFKVRQHSIFAIYVYLIYSIIIYFYYKFI